MDSESPYPPPKRRRTSCQDSTPSRSPSRERNQTRHARPYSRSRTHSQSRSRSPNQRRRRSRSITDSSPYSPRSYQRDYTRSPSPTQTKPGPAPRTLKYTPLITLPRAHARGITCAKFSPDYSLLATGSADSTINIYSVPTSPDPSNPSSTANTFKHLRTLRAHLAGVNALAWSPSGPPHTYTLASASDDKSILLWSPLSSDFPIAPSPITGHSNYVYSLAFSPKGNMLVSGSYDEAIFLWDVRSGRTMRQLPAHSDPVGGVDFIQDGTMVCSCSTDGLIRIWDAGTGQCLRTLVDEDRKGVTSVRFSPNGRYVLGWTLDGCVRLWDYVGGRCVKTYMGHVNKEFSLGGGIGTYLSPDGTEHGFVVSGSEDGDVVAWDVSSKELLWRGEGHKDVVLSVDCGKTKDGTRGLLVSVGKDRDVRVWIEDVDEKVLGLMKERKGEGADDDGDAQMAIADDEDEEHIRSMEAQQDRAQGDGMEEVENGTVDA